MTKRRGSSSTEKPLSALVLATKAERDLAKVSKSTLARVEKALKDLRAGAANLDVKSLRGMDPWIRLRVGSYRILYRALDAEELTKLRPAEKGFLIARVVPRAELDRESKKLT
ncbi:MAG: type II toxin-antitoxin system RelE family toxin [Actinomycetota bacterium]